MTSREQCLTADANDALAAMRREFDLAGVDAEGAIYLDGNSLGPLPARTMPRLRQVIEEEWGGDIIRSWNSAGWIALAGRVGDKIARLIGADLGEVVVADSTSINLYKVLHAALTLAEAGAPRRRRILSERANFPSDLYIVDSVAHERGYELLLVDAQDVPMSVDDDVAVVCLTHVNYRTGQMHDLRAITRAAHDVGALIVWDLAHSVGAVPVDLKGKDSPRDAADFAVGCGYKYLNGGPGAPAFVWAHARHTDRMDRDQLRQPLPGWFGHASPFDFSPDYRPATGVGRFVCGTPPVLSLAALECGVDVLLDAEKHGGMAALRDKSTRLTDLFIALVESRCAGHGVSLVTPRDSSGRGSQVCFAHPTDAYAIVQALIARGVIGDFRAPDILRFGFAPLYTRFVDVWDAVDRLVTVLDTGEWRDARFGVRAAVT